MRKTYLIATIVLNLKYRKLTFLFQKKKVNLNKKEAKIKAIWEESGKTDEMINSQC